MNANNNVTNRLEFYEPPMCCASGICGPSVDKNLVQLQADIEELRSKYSGLIIERYMISQQPLKFKENKAVYQLVREKGKKVLPITTFNGEIIKIQRYPDLAEIEQRIVGARNGD